MKCKSEDWGYDERKLTGTRCGYEMQRWNIFLKPGKSFDKVEPCRVYMAQGERQKRKI